MQGCFSMSTGQKYYIEAEVDVNQQGKSNITTNTMIGVAHKYEKPGDRHNRKLPFSFCL